ncbi:MBL fold metallo-hydrolase [Thermoactinomyces sp. CICC 24226]|uniref:MBL fold metallo-hydrolase n=1 Tax=Thermoactinomyces sp. CICC 24226 TaxID=2767431 RepID=UPI0018DB0E8B|nr:MBL fold metallo-hydrolase [Thermoactinomyces sp. CICC 24226]MBI0392649.1 MBL fold metallo-hydrolase [Thermoactinomyces sp. CICC 24226]
MRWTVLGCHSPYPAPGGGTPGYLLEAEGKKILIDCGSGILARLVERIAIEALDAVLLSHLHHDHIVDFFCFAVRGHDRPKTREKETPPCGLVTGETGRLV